MQQFWDAPPTEFSGKIWIFIVTALVFGGLAGFSLVLGPLFLFQIMSDAKGQPATDALAVEVWFAGGVGGTDGLVVGISLHC